MSTTNYSATAQDADWRWDFAKSELLGSMDLHHNSKYDVSLLYKHDSTGVTVSVLQGNEQKYSWFGSRYTPLVIEGDHLYYVPYLLGGGGRTLIAIDLIAGKEIWRSEFPDEPNPPAGTYPAPTLVNLSANSDIVDVYGLYGNTGFYEIMSASTGERLGLKFYEKQAIEDAKKNAAN